MSWFYEEQKVKPDFNKKVDKSLKSIGFTRAKPKMKARNIKPKAREKPKIVITSRDMQIFYDSTYSYKDWNSPKVMAMRLQADKENREAERYLGKSKKFIRK